MPVTEGKAWLVTGRSGDYSDRKEWPVAVYLDADDATAHANAAALRGNEVAAWRCSKCDDLWGYHYDEAGCSERRPTNEYDPAMQQVCGDGAEYGVEPVAFPSVFKQALGEPSPCRYRSEALGEREYTCREPAETDGLCRAHYRLRPGHGAEAKAR